MVSMALAALSLQTLTNLNFPAKLARNVGMLGSVQFKTASRGSKWRMLVLIGVLDAAMW